MSGTVTYSCLGELRYSERLVSTGCAFCHSVGSRTVCIAFCVSHLVCCALRVLPSVSRDLAAGLCVCLGLYTYTMRRGSAWAHLISLMSPHWLGLHRFNNPRTWQNVYIITPSSLRQQSMAANLLEPLYCYICRSLFHLFSTFSVFGRRQQHCGWSGSSRLLHTVWFGLTSQSNAESGSLFGTPSSFFE